MKLLSDRAAVGLRNALNLSGYSEWYQRHAGSDYEVDPWLSFDKVFVVAHQEEAHKLSLIHLFLLHLSVPENCITSVLGQEVTDDLLTSGILTSTGARIKSNYCVLSTFGKYLLVEYPVATYGGMRISSNTYLSSLSYRLATIARAYIPVGTVLDLGCGTGLFSLLASQLCPRVLATDIDGSALKLAQANMALNDCSVLMLQTDMFQGISDYSFDLAVFNPPWRLVPPEIAYPNVLARVGSGYDGLDALRKFLTGLPNHMVDGGRAILVAEFPGDERGFEFARELKEFAARSGCSVYLTPDRPVHVTDQAWLSAKTAWYLNNHLSIDELAGRFLRHYEELGYRLLHPVQCMIHNDGMGKVHQSRLSPGDALERHTIPRTATRSSVIAGKHGEG